MNAPSVSLLIAVLYLSTTALIVGFLSSRPAGGGRQMPLFLAPGFLALLVHGMAVGAAVNTSSGLNLGFFNALSLIAWLVAVQILVASVYRPLENLGIIMLPVAAVAAVLAALLPSDRTVAIADPSVQVHIVLSVLAYSLLTLAALQALLLAVQDHYLRNHHPGGIIRFLPPLTAMETLLFQMIGFGFALLTLALASGFFYLDDLFGQSLVHKTVLSLVAWFFFALLLYGRLRFGWRGRTAIQLTLWGFALLMLAYFGSKLVLELILQRAAG